MGTQALTASPLGYLESTTNLGTNLSLCSSVAAAGDFNNDGNLDVVMASATIPPYDGSPPPPLCGEGPLMLMTLSGNGDGTFAVPASPSLSPSPASPSQVITGDFNGDGNLDLVMGVSLYLGNGDGSFQAPVNVQPASEFNSRPTAIATADFNGDGIPDLAIGYWDAMGEELDQVAILLGNGDGTFTLKSSMNVPVTLADDVAPLVAVGDLNGDGLADIVVSHGWTLTAFLGNGDGTFQAPAIFTAGSSFPGGQPAATNNLAMVDLAGKGSSEIIWVTGTDATPGLSLNVITFSAGTSPPGTSIFSVAHYPFPSDSNGPVKPEALDFGDFNYDGNFDIALYDDTAGQFLVFWGNGDSTLQTTPTAVPVPGSPTGVYQVAEADFANKGNFDLALIDGPNTNLNLLQPAAAATASAANVAVPDCGLQDVNASYTGDPNFAPSTSNTVSLDQQNAVPAVSANGVPTTTTTGNPFTVTASVTPQCSGGITPTGSIEYMLIPGNPVLAQGTLSGTPPSFSATVNTAAQPIPIGSYDVYVRYSGDSNWLFTSEFLPLAVQGTANVSMSYTGSSIVTAGAPFAISGQLTTNQTGPAPTGSVTLLDNGKAIATASLTGNPPFALSFSVNTQANPLTAGSNVLSLSYPGNSLWVGSTSSTVTVTVTATDTVALISNLPSSQVVLSGANAQFTATVTPVGSSTAPVGTVQFYDGATAIGASVQLANGTAGFTSESFTVGSHSVTAHYSGDSNYGAINSQPITFTVVSPGTSVITLTAPPPSNLLRAGSVSVTATVSESTMALGPVPTGTVTFKNNGVVVGTGAVGSAGTATFTLNPIASGFALGANTLVASYSGDSNWSSSTSGPVTYQIQQGQPSFSGFSCSAANSPVGASLTCTSSLMWSWPHYTPPSPTGSVTLLDNGTAIGSEAISGGSSFGISFSINTTSSPLAAGSHVLSLSYAGDSGWLSASSGSQTVTLTPAAPTFMLTSNLGSYGSVVQGTTVTFTGTVGGAVGTPTGTVQFYIDGTAAGAPVTMSGGVATYATSSLGPGTHTITAAYSGNNYYGSVTTNGVVTVVTQGGDSIAIGITGPASVSLGIPINVTGTLAAGALGPALTGTVLLLDGSTTIATTTLSGNSPATVTFSVNTAGQPLAVGTHRFSLRYGGATQWAASTSSAAAVTVTQAVTTTTVTTSAAAAAFGASVTFTAAVTSTVTAPTPTGTVQFYDGLNALGSAVPVANGSATCTTSALTAGTHSITAVYSGDTNFATSTSAALTESVQDFTLQTAGSSLSVAPGASATVTLTVTGEGGLDASTSFACAGLPSEASCTFSPATIAGSGTTTLTITTTGNTAMAFSPQLKMLLPRAAVFACVLGLIWPGRRRRQLFLLALLALLPPLTLGCGGGSSNSGGGGGGNSGTPAGTYAVTVTATAGSGRSAITQTTTITLTVQ